MKLRLDKTYVCQIVMSKLLSDKEQLSGILNNLYF